MNEVRGTLTFQSQKVLLQRQTMFALVLLLKKLDPAATIERSKGIVEVQYSVRFVFWLQEPKVYTRYTSKTCHHRTTTNVSACYCLVTPRSTLASCHTKSRVEVASSAKPNSQMTFLYPEEYLCVPQGTSYTIKVNCLNHISKRMQASNILPCHVYIIHMTLQQPYYVLMGFCCRFGITFLPNLQINLYTFYTLLK